MFALKSSVSFNSIMFGFILMAGLVCASSNLVVLSESDTAESEYQSQVQAGNLKDRKGSQSRDSSNQNQLESLFNFGMNPLGSTMKYFLPGTYQGLTSDANNGLSMLTNGAQHTLGSYNPFDNVNKGYYSFQQGAMNRLKGNEEFLSKAYEALMNPQQYCTNWIAQQSSQLAALANQAGMQLSQSSGQAIKNLGQEAESSLSQAGQLANQGAQQSGSFLTKLGSYAFGG